MNVRYVQPEPIFGPKGKSDHLSSRNACRVCRDFRDCFFFFYGKATIIDATRNAIVLFLYFGFQNDFFSGSLFDVFPIAYGILFDSMAQRLIV